MAKKKFADVPRWTYFLAQLVLTLPTPFLFFYLSGYSQPLSIFMFLRDIFFSLVSLIVFLPALFFAMAILKLLFYGSLMGTQRKVSLKAKNRMTFLFILLASPPAVIIQAKFLLLLTQRSSSWELAELCLNGFWLFVAGLPSFIFSLKELKDKVRAIKHKETIHVRGCDRGSECENS